MNTILKTSIFALTLGFGIAAHADDASQTFEWYGKVMDAPIGGDTKIVGDGFEDGLLTFTEGASAGEYEIAGSSTITFGVEEQGVPSTSFDYEIKNLQFSAGGDIMREVDLTAPEFTIEANGTNLVKDQPVVGASGDVNLRVVNEQPLTILEPGDDVLVHATVLVTNSI
ncbi:hypothetical protein ACT0HV_000575 [Vibrio diabolicus]